MKFLGLLAAAGLLFAQAIAPDTVIGSVDGKNITAGEARRLTTGIRPDGLQILENDPQGMLSNLFLLKHLADQAVAHDLPAKSPFKEELESSRSDILARAEITEQANRSNPSPDEAEKYFRDNASKYEEVKVRVIYIAFTPDGAPKLAVSKKTRSEAEAKKKAEDLVKQLRAGADFEKVVGENSEDEQSAKKGGEFGTFKRSDSLPANVMDVLFSAEEMKPTDPVRISPGYYIFRVDKKSRVPYDEVRERIFDELKQHKFDTWFQGLKKRFDVHLDKPDLLSADDGTTVGTVDGHSLNAGEVKRMVSGFPPEARQAMKKDPVAVLSQHFLFRHLATLGEKDGLDQRSPLKEQLESIRTEMLAQAEAAQRLYAFAPTVEEAEARYKANPAEYQQAAIHAILIRFAPETAKPAAGAKQALTEPEAKAKAEDLLKQLRAGADFAKLARENSGDEASAAKGGDYDVVKRTDSMAPEVVNAIFALKPGEISEPVRQTDGFYLFRVDSKSLMPFADVRDRISADMKRTRFEEWRKGLQKRFQVKLDKPEAITPSGAAPKPAR